MSNAIRREPVWLMTLACLPPAVGLVNLYAGGIEIFKGHAAPVLLTVGSCFVALLLWLPFVSIGQWSGIAITSLSLIFFAWFAVVARIHLEGSSLDAGVFVIPLLILLTIFKPITQRQALAVSVVFAVAVVVCAVIVVVLGMFTNLPSGFLYEAGSQRIALLRDFGLEWRWSGPFIHSNLAGPLAGAVVLVGFFSRGWGRWVLIAGGVLILTLSQSRTGVMALLICSAILLGIRLLIDKRKWSLASSVGSIGICIVVLAYFLSQDRTMSARTPAWVDFWNLMLSAPLSGVGNAGVRDYLQSNATVGQFAQPHAHNFLLDLGALWGVPVLLLSGITLSLAIWLGFRAVLQGTWLGFALAVFVTIVGIAETPFTWSHASPLMMVLFLSVLVSATATSQQNRQVEVAPRIPRA